MYVGVIPPVAPVLPFGPCIPHVCGGDPNAVQHGTALNMYSPCMWG